MSNYISTLGFNNAYLDQELDLYHLGNGYRDYNPTTIQFNAPDDMSPFGAGGINPYVYCSGDPINNTDPTGHFNFLGLLSTGVSLISPISLPDKWTLKGIAGAIGLTIIFIGIDIATDGLAEAIIPALRSVEAAAKGAKVIGEEALNSGAGNLFEKLISPFSKLAKHGPFRLSGEPEDSARAGRAFARTEEDATRINVISADLYNQNSLWEMLNEHIDNIPLYKGPLNKDHVGWNIQQALRKELQLPYKYADGTIIIPRNNDFSLLIYRKNPTYYSLNPAPDHRLPPPLNTTITRNYLQKIFDNGRSLLDMRTKELIIWTP